ncbi:peptidase [Pseudonocardia sulfidoxydans NBRC 16205]|uniref:Peptidase n=1 Tax=Pseudonocardia sulfidoxydans NBRC 16205 TaxID=1223511 RepID=A0A511DJ53_9PSEU|nr:prolyl oligopeptidase family serine peptidase [Pseudonocardia sulfidoxydans]GEL23048.1 peptidase [Pseudonocardia sulfidoxydans NBRC 16205]
METITGVAAGVPFTALPPANPVDGAAPLVVTWHMVDAPRTDAAFAAALPMAGVPAWRVHLGLPMCGARMVDGGLDAVVALAREDALLAFLAPFVRQAAEEFPAALAALREQLPVDHAPPGILGGSLGGAVALQVLVASVVPVGAVALVNAAVRVGSAVELVEGLAGHPYAWTAEAERAAAELDFVARVADLASQPPLLLVSGEHDHARFRADAVELVDALRARYVHPDDIELVAVPGLAHPLADEPGLEPAAQRPTARAVDAILTDWFRARLTS